MLLLLSGRLAFTSGIRISALARLLLDQETEIELQQVHTSLQTEHLREKRGLKNHLIPVESAHMSRKTVDRLANMPLLSLRLLMKMAPDLLSQHT